MNKDTIKIKQALESCYEHPSGSRYYDAELVAAALAQLSAAPSDAQPQEQPKPVAEVNCGDDGFFATILPGAIVEVGQSLYSEPFRQPEFKHLDDAAVDRFAIVMKDKLTLARAKGRGGWDNEALCTVEHLSNLLREHVEKGDPVDVANFCMMLQQRGSGITSCATSKEASLANQALMEAKREGVGEHYRLVMLRQREHAEAGRFKEANECVAIRAEFERMASSKEASAPARDDVLPLLPQAEIIVTDSGNAWNAAANPEMEGVLHYTADQMRDYARAAIAMQSHPAQAGKEAFNVFLKDCAVSGEDEPQYTVCFSVGVQSFRLDYTANKEESDWIVNQLTKALSRIAAPAASVPAQAVTLTNDEIRKISRRMPNQPWGIGSRIEDAVVFARAIERRLLSGSAKTAIAEPLSDDAIDAEVRSWFGPIAETGIFNRMRFRKFARAVRGEAND